MIECYLHLVTCRCQQDLGFGAGEAKSHGSLFVEKNHPCPEYHNMCSNRVAERADEALQRGASSTLSYCEDQVISEKLRALQSQSRVLRVFAPTLLCIMNKTRLPLTRRHSVIGPRKVPMMPIAVCL